MFTHVIIILTVASATVVTGFPPYYPYYLGCDQYKIIQEEVDFEEATKVCKELNAELPSVLDRHLMQQCLGELLPPLKFVWIKSTADDEHKCMVAAPYPATGLILHPTDCTKKNYFLCLQTDAKNGHD